MEDAGKLYGDRILVKEQTEEMKQQSIGYYSLKLHCDIGSIIVRTGGKENAKS
jgi:hypothetical protein